MSKLSKRAVLSVLTLVLTFVALGATTFAWFSLGTTATVNPFEVQVKGSEGLEMSFQLKGDNDQDLPMNELEWFSTLNTDNMKKYLFNGGTVGETDYNGVFQNGKLDAVTTSNGTSFEKFDGVNGEGVVALKTAESNKDYLEFTLNFRTKMEGQQLNITELNFDSTSETWNADIPFTDHNGNDKEVGNEVKAYAHHAARVSFINKEGSSENAKSFQANKSEAGNIGVESDKGAHNYLAAKWGVDNIELVTGNSQTYIDGAKEEGAYTEDNKILEFSNTTYDEGEYYIASVVVRVWIEGWDGNAYDAIFDSTFSVGFSFEIK